MSALSQRLVFDQVFRYGVGFWRMMSGPFYCDGFHLISGVADRHLFPMRRSRFGSGPKLIAGKPVHRLLKVAKGPHVPSSYPADEGKQPRALITLGGVENCQTQIPGEADVAKSINERREFVGRKFGAGVAPIEQGAVYPASLAGFSETVERRATGHKIELALSSEADEFRRTYDFKLHRHFLKVVDTARQNNARCFIGTVAHRWNCAE